MGAVAIHLYTGLINEPSNSFPGSLHSLGSRPSPAWAGFHLGLDGQPCPSSRPVWPWAGVESLFQAQVWSRLSPAPCKPYQDIQALVLMAGKVAVCLLDSYRREGDTNNGLLLFPCRSSGRLERIFMCCCRPRILWPDPALILRCAGLHAGHAQLPGGQTGPFFLGSGISGVSSNQNDSAIPGVRSKWLFANAKPIHLAGKLSVLRPGLQNLQLPMQVLLETFRVQTTPCLSFPACKTGCQAAPPGRACLEPGV